MDFTALTTFLKELQENNNKDWMDKNRNRYKKLRAEFILWLDQLNHMLAEIDDEYYSTPGKKGINRINNNLMFHPNKPVYKDHFAAGLDKAPNSGDFYLEIGIHESLFAGGIWRPEPIVLRSIRDALDYNGDEFKMIIDKPSFRKTFGGLYEDQKLKTSPKGFSADHPHIDLIRNKTFGVVHTFPNDVIFKKSFTKKIIEVYQEMLPFRRYLNKAISV
ncbi:DUF2461 domain-containing protein [Muriicola sp. Z0-33]|uniref:DUF2461 domain-containing protein n=1 Tax=Muriicola sp. Z0-33 TaxID=2816957 RepID=UPI002236FF77|nr:DUF2461 domain-containing protein [Muriicola sp. Z0-33]MCW5516974.1 DUF2461 domain-containing protein [Muriicola sp. Z0-33]